MVTAEKILQRAEKHRNLGRFDKTSAISFLNDALYEVSKRQSLKIRETYNNFTENPIKLNDNVIKIDSVKINNNETERFRARVMPNGEVLLYIRNNGDFREIKPSDNISIDKIDFEYTGYKQIESSSDEIDIPNKFETAVVYFVRSKMFEEIGELEFSNYFLSQYMREISMKSNPTIDVTSKPSKYSLL